MNDALPTQHLDAAAIQAGDTIRLLGATVDLHIQAVTTSRGGNVQLRATSHALGHPTTITRYLTAGQEVVLVSRVDTHLTTTTAAVELADELVCRDGACTAATSHREECTCRCGGEGHGLERQAQEAAGRAHRRQITATRGAFACLPTPADDDPELAPHRFVPVAVADPDAW